MPTCKIGKRKNGEFVWHSDVCGLVPDFCLDRISTSAATIKLRHYRPGVAGVRARSLGLGLGNRSIRCVQGIHADAMSVKDFRELERQSMSSSLSTPAKAGA